MTITGTTAFNPSLGEIVLNAFARIGMRRTALLANHMQDAYTEANLLQAEWNNKQVNLWKVDATPVQVALTQGTASYSIPSNVVMILDAYINTGGTDYIIQPISRTEYSAIPVKTQQGRPTQFWFDRLESPTLYLWMVPDANSTYTLNYYSCTLIDDSALADGQTADIPQLWLDAYAAGLAFRLARIYAPQMRDQLKMDYMEAWNTAATQNIENVPLSIVPGTYGYFK